ncbi:PREDICTED: uncharacterized protein LOC105562292 [Vollenhovia emeryi]|uniref:uncharacterized protein LOC105562292 n=1 Tax=Vollenhovia emeryi TaxID=411798 RepID=UPI0005F3C3C4|nr:PREDICTED: uncharacterized protein LOC105562292 [Vollenhovia emeryi]
MSLCPSSSHQLVAAAIAFRRARRKFPKDFGLESVAERAPGNNTKTQETATSREGPINQARSSSTLVRRACNSRSDHMCPASVRSRGYERFRGKETSVGCSCRRTGNVGEDISGLRDEYSGGDAVDTVPSRECGEPVPSGADRKNGFAKPPDRDRCEARGSDVSGEKARHKSWRDQMRGENSRLYARQCYSKEYSGIMPASRERNDEECREKNDDGDDGEDEDDDSGVAVINHKDSMCILAEKYKAGGKWRGDRDECNKSLTSEIIDQPESPAEIASAAPHEGPSAKHVRRAARCESCGTAAITGTRARGCGRHASPEGEFDRFESPSSEATAVRRCSSRAPCRRAF